MSITSDRPSIVVVDDNGQRRSRIQQQGQAVLARSEEILRAARVAIVLLAQDGARSSELAHWSARGVHLIAYATAASTWSIARRCRVLLEGAREFVDDTPTCIDEALRRALDEERSRAADERALSLVLEGVGVIAESASMREVFRRVLQVSVLSDLPTLITGETGTGKQLVAEALHRHDSKRRNGPFVVVNCGAITSTLAEAELFGHRRGAFTGAERERKGLVRAADGGVLFLDEIGELEPAVQAKLLRVIQDQLVLAVGDDREAPVSVRVIGATNRDLRAAVAAGTFREDLLHRLNVVAIHVPPIRDRREDIAPLVRHFLDKHRSISRGLTMEAAPDFIEALSLLDLPGNVRQIENLVRSAMVHAGSRVVSLRDLPPDVWSCLSASNATAPPRPSDTFARTLLDAHPGNLASALEACERALISEALERSRGNQTRMARMLGVTPRCVYNKIRRHRLSA